jgi:prepilin-type N-terminal cleavage/methylation domain-containing protein
MIGRFPNLQRCSMRQINSRPSFSLWNGIRDRLQSGSTTEKSRRPSDPEELRSNRSKGGFTLVEMAVTIAVILILVGIASIGIQPYIAYRDGRAGGEMLRAVKAAQLMYLSDYPSTPVTSLTQALILPYMPSGTWPKLPPVNGVTPTINCAEFPPRAYLNGIAYDPTASATDSLWDVGQY